MASAAPVYEGQTFRGEAVILGKAYYTIYAPIFSTDGKVIGIAVGKGAGEALNFAVQVEKLEALLRRITPGSRPRPLEALSDERSPLENLLISAGGLAAIALLWWLTPRLLGRRQRARARKRRARQ